MKVVLVYNYLPTHLGGIETILDALAREYVRRGHQVSVFGADVPKLNVRAPTKEYKLVGAPALNVLEERLGVPYPLPHPRLFRQLRRAVLDADLILGHGFLCLPTLSAFAFARLWNPRATCLLTEHVGHVPYDSVALDRIEAAAIQTLGRTVMQLSHGVIVYNTRAEAELKKLSPSTPVEWIPNGVDLNAFRPPKPGEREALRAKLGWDARPRALFVGRMVAKKGAHLAVEAAGLAGGAFEVVLAGPGESTNLKGPHTTILGPLAPEKVAELYRAADALLLPSHGEGFPVTAQEAMASGLPIFLGEDDSYDRYARLSGNAIRQVPRDAKIIASTMKTFFASPRTSSLMDDIAGAARRLFSWDSTVTTYDQFASRVHPAHSPERASRVAA